ncbi:cyclopropane-fatty-acyl-phospholipid synthase family protein [Pelagibacteraceae bacterium]|nr:cyclopropane-fatty-acyl-phospholipid synthase family protein [Pelagibacteraceae bacterium]
MLVARLFSKIYKIGGIILIDSFGQKFICGKPDLKKPLTLKILDKSLNWKLLINPDLSFPEAYMKGLIKIENGSLLDFLNLTFKNLGRSEINTSGYFIKKMLHAWRFFTNFNLPIKSKKNVEHHYDIGEDLYDLFLDKLHRQYSCAYWKSPNDTLEEAQQNKINHIIKKLNLKPGQRVLDIGSGWGSMCFEIAKQSECEVTGYTLSKNQYDYCIQKAKELKLDNQCHFELSDYREIKGKFNRIVSVGMLEHVGRKFYKTFFKKINKLLTDDGLALIHTIGSTEPKGPPQPFIQKYIFPGGLVPSGSDLIDAIEKTGLVLSDMESLIHHYDKTLKAWLDRFLENREKVKKMYSESFCKMWEFYLAGCSAAFHHRDLLVYQLQIVKNFSTIPSNRRDYIYN